jgi:DNA-binding winged helix-turn-helix (wHTH) protein
LVTRLDGDIGGARLVVEQGIPFLQGAVFELYRRQTVVGRATASFRPEIAFDSLLISRRHCCIEQEGQDYCLVDQGSKHGTSLNGRLLTERQPVFLTDGDIIGLADGVIRLRFLQRTDLDSTLDLGDAPITQEPERPTSGMIVDLKRHTLCLDAVEVGLSAKEWRLLALLYQNRHELVSYEAIRAAVWPERRFSDGSVPDVGMEELNVLVHRLRRKMGDYGACLVTRRGQEFILETPNL